MHNITCLANHFVRGLNFITTVDNFSPEKENLTKMRATLKSLPLSDIHVGFGGERHSLFKLVIVFGGSSRLCYGSMKST